MNRKTTLIAVEISGPAETIEQLRNELKRVINKETNRQIEATEGQHILFTIREFGVTDPDAKGWVFAHS